MSVWVAGATVVAGIGSSVISSNKAAKSQKAQMQLQREQFNFAKQRYDQAQNMYGGLQQQVVDSAREGVKADLQGVSDRAAADIASQFRGAQLGLARTNQRLGINPNSGQYQSQMRQSALAEALGKAGGITRAREGERNNAEQQTFARRAQIAQVGVNQMNGTASGVQDASSGLAAALLVEGCA
jgi:predicted Zn-dependent protease